MATAKKTTRTKSVKPPAVDTSKFFSTSLSGKDTKKKAKTEKPTSHFSTDSDDGPSLADLADQWVAASRVESIAKRKASEARSVLDKFLLSDFAQRWSKEKARPETRMWKSLKSSFNYVMTSKITMTEEKEEAIREEIGIDMSEHMEVLGFKIDLKALQDRPDSMNAFVSFLETLSEEEPETTKVMSRMLKLKPSFFERLYDVCKQSKQKLARMLEILQPQAQFRSVNSQFAEEHLFDIVKDMEG